MRSSICSQVSGPGSNVPGKVHPFMEADSGNSGLIFLFWSFR